MPAQEVYDNQVGFIWTGRVNKHKRWGKGVTTTINTSVGGHDKKNEKEQWLKRESGGWMCKEENKREEKKKKRFRIVISF